MKKIILTTPILASLLLFGCANGNKDANGFTIPDPETFVQEVSKTASIAVKRYNKKSEFLIASDPTYITAQRHLILIYILIGRLFTRPIYRLILGLNMKLIHHIKQRLLGLIQIQK